MNQGSVLQTVLPLAAAGLLAAVTLHGAKRVWRPSLPTEQKTMQCKATLTAGLLLGAACAAGAAFFVVYGLVSCPPPHTLERALRYVFPSSMDAGHYISLAQYGYRAEGAELFPSQHLMIVFFPLWPLLIRLGTALTGAGGYQVGLLWQIPLFGLAGAGLYRLTATHFGEKTARWTLAFLVTMPGSFFFAAPMTESLYLALTVWALVCLDDERPAAFALLGFLAALTRSTGGLLLGAAVLAALLRWREKRPGAGWLGAALGPAAGTGVYLALNQLVYGDPFAFVQIQRSHWAQGLGWVGDTLRYLLYYAGRWWNTDREFVCVVSLPAIVCILWACLALFLVRRKLPVCWLAYGVAYILMAYGTTWLLSAPRYALSLPLLPLAMALLCRKNWQRRLVLVLNCTAGAVYLSEFLGWGYVY